MRSSSPGIAVSSLALFVGFLLVIPVLSSPAFAQDSRELEIPEFRETGGPEIVAFYWVSATALRDPSRLSSWQESAEDLREAFSRPGRTRRDCRPSPEPVTPPESTDSPKPFVEVVARHDTIVLAEVIAQTPGMLAFDDHFPTTLLSVEIRNVLQDTHDTVHPGEIVHHLVSGARFELAGGMVCGEPYRELPPIGTEVLLAGSRDGVFFDGMLSTPPLAFSMKQQ